MGACVMALGTEHPALQRDPWRASWAACILQAFEHATRCRAKVQAGTLNPTCLLSFRPPWLVPSTWWF